MKTRKVVPRDQANRDIDDVIAHYLKEGADSAALGFIDELQRAYVHIGRNPGTGSPRYAHQLDMPGLRSWPTARFPYLIFYFEQPDTIDVWRVLHAQRDIPVWMQAPETDA